MDTQFTEESEFDPGPISRGPNPRARAGDVAAARARICEEVTRRAEMQCKKRKSGTYLIDEEAADYSAAGVLLITREGKFILGKDKNEKWSDCGGKKEITDGNNPKKTAVRECVEECGLTEGDFDVIGKWYCKRSRYLCYFAILKPGINFLVTNGGELTEFKIANSSMRKHPRLWSGDLWEAANASIASVNKTAKEEAEPAAETPSEIAADILASRPHDGAANLEAAQAGATAAAVIARAEFEIVKSLPCATKTQLVCITNLKALSNTFDKDSNEYKVALKVLGATKNRRPAWEELGSDMEGLEVGEIKVEYYEASIGPQRRYAKPYVELFSLDRKHGLRGAAAYGLYKDFDLEGAYQVILQGLCKQHGIESPELDEHLLNREGQLKEVGELLDKEAEAATRRKAAKEYFNAVYNGAGSNFETAWAKEWGVVKSKPFPLCARRFKKEMSEVSVALIAKYPELERQVKEIYPLKRQNSVVFYILSREERKAIDAMENELSAMNIRLDSYQGDGGFCRVEDIIKSGIAVEDIEMRLTDAIRRATGMAHTIKAKEIELPKLPAAPTLEFMSDTIANTDNPEDFNGYIEIMNRHFVTIREMNDTVLQLRYGEDGTIKNIHYTNRKSIMQTFAGCGTVLEKITEPTEEELKESPWLKPRKIYCDLFGNGGYFWRRERRMARRIVFEPRPGGEVDSLDFNTFQGLPFDKPFRDREEEFRHKIKNGELGEGTKFLLELIREILADNDTARAENIFRTLNRNLVTRTKVDHFMAFIGEPGSYKSLFFGDDGIFASFYGGVERGHYVIFTDIAHLMADFSAEMEKALFVYLEEAKPYRKANINSDKFKHKVDGKSLRVRKMHTDAFHIQSHFNMVAGSNNDDAFKIEEGQRRISLHATNNRWAQQRVVEGTITQKEKDDHDNKCWGYAKDPEVLLELFAYFMLYHEIIDVGDWVNKKIRPVETELLSSQMEYNKCPIGRWLREWQSENVQMFIEEMVGGGDRSNPEVQDRQVTVANWGNAYKPTEMYTIFKRYLGEYHPDERDMGSIGFGMKLTKYAREEYGASDATADKFLVKTDASSHRPSYRGIQIAQ